MEIQCENAEAHACAELAICYRNIIPYRPQKESSEEVEAKRMTQIAVDHYVRAKELKQRWVDGAVPSGSNVNKAIGNGTVAPPPPGSAAASQMLALGPSKTSSIPGSPARGSPPLVWKFELVRV